MTDDTYGAAHESRPVIAASDAKIDPASTYAVIVALFFVAVDPEPMPKQPAPPAAPPAATAAAAGPPSHPYLGREMYDPDHRLCLDVHLNGVHLMRKVQLTGNQTEIAVSFLEDEERHVRAASDDPTRKPPAIGEEAIETLRAWVQPRLELKVTSRVEMRERLRRSRTAPRLLL